MRRRFLLAALLLLCGPPAHAEDPPPAPPGAPPAPLPFSEEVAFLGLSDVRVDAAGTALPADLGGMGVAWAQTEAVRWDAVQPQPPIGGRVLSDWNALDATVGSWQRAGFAVLVTLSPASSWASQPKEATDWARFAKEKLAPADAALAVRGATGVGPPRPEHWRDWQAFVRAAVERYDGDGQEDAPGLRRPVKAFQILDRVQDSDHWLGSAEDYQRLLHHAAEGAGEASPTCEVVHAAVDLRGLFRAEDPDVDEWKHRLVTVVPAVPPRMRLEVERGIALVLRSLEMPSLYRALPHLGSGNLVEDGVNLRALRTLLDRRSVTNVPVWLTGSPVRRLTPPRVPLPGAARDGVVQRALDLQVKDALRDGRLFADGRRESAGPAMEWLQRGAAYDLVRGVAFARASRVERIFMSDGDAEFQRSPRRPADPAPCWCAARQMNALLLGHRTASEAPLGTAGAAVVFSFAESAPLSWVAVLLPDVGGSWAGTLREASPTVRAQVPLPPGEVDIEEIALTDGPPKRRRAKVVEGLLAIEATPAPVYVFPAR